MRPHALFGKADIINPNDISSSAITLLKPASQAISPPHQGF
jgi:hypothetical protein